ncbi:QWRF motif-containing protein 2-like [Humulus lupulus]|uniref:QWRF motif-containing protein 2-like n=1 Tax=Humulus lupulus TaxID=3486 RepID=UPI002B40791A|nr:QWRF motif-containing protein 2-like [Humulus lupulus]
MVTAVRTTLNPKTSTEGVGRPQNHARHPLLPSELDNGLAPPRRPKTREVTSRYMSSSNSSSSSSSSSSASSTSFGFRRCASPMISRTSNSTGSITPAPASMPNTKRAQSVERRRAATPRPSSLDLKHLGGGAGGGVGSEMTAVQKMLFTSTRSLSVSFQGESFSFQVSKVKPAPSPSVRKGTPERRKAGTTLPRGYQSEDSKPVESQRWPGRLRESDCMNRSLDSNDERRRSTGGSCGNVTRALQNSIVDDVDRTPVKRRLSSASGNAELLKTAEPVVEVNSIGSDAFSDHIASSDSESVSSGCTTPGTLEFGGGVYQEQRGSRGVVAAARFWQESKNRSLRLPEPGSPSSRSTAMRAFAPSKLVAPKKLSIETPVLSPRGVLSSRRGQSSPILGSFRPSSPSKACMSAVSSPLRGMSPSRIRSLIPGTESNKNAPSILSFAVDIRRGKAGENRILDAHALRLLYNRLLQWRFINARADASHSAQRLNAERSIYNAWVTTAQLRESVRTKRIELQLLRQTLKLISILKGQMVYLEEWSLLDRDYTGSLSGAFEALKASTLRLPVVAGARADVQNVKDAVCSAVDVMQAMASSICLLTSKVGQVNSLVGEISSLTAKERALLGQCKNLLSTIAALQVKDCSLRTHILQLKRMQT